MANMIFAVVAGQAGCFTLAVILGALLLGIWLDSMFNVKGPFVIGALLLSVPVSLFFMVRIALGAVKRMTPPTPKNNPPSRRPTVEQEEDF